MKKLAVFVVLFGAAASAETTSATLPETKPGQIMTAWFKLCDAPDLKALTNWTSQNLSERALKRFPAEGRAQDDYDECTATSGYRIAKVTRSESKSIEMLVVGRKTGIWSNYSIELNDQDKIDRARFFPTTPPEESLPKHLSDEAIARELTSHIAKASQAGLFSGIVSIARGTKTIASAAGGYANHTSKTPITGSTQFTLGSLGKMFTAAAIGQLVDQKKISFDDAIGKFFPDYPNQTVREKVTLGMLLTHTSGMGDFLGKRTPDMMKNGVKRASDFMPLYDKDEPQFAPGSNRAYSNAGLALAGAIVEKVSGEAYPDYIRKHIFEPAGMTNSDPNNIPHRDPRMVTPYTKFGPTGPAKYWREAEADIGSPAGGAISTADDLVKFADALRTGKLVSRATFEELAKPRGGETTAFGGKYGYAMEIKEVYGQTAVGHGGGFPGVSTHLYIILNSPYTVVVLANQDPPADANGGLYALGLMAERAKRKN
ncbi:MAG TPA: serine hydrolase domain-containing protein [Terriglobales bacterium]|nr:serine hydrolase domain-containing protein [Terriglobales bacterium]